MDINFFVNKTATVLSSAVRNATTQSPVQKNPACRGAYFFLDITAVTAAQTVTFSIQVKDPTSGKWVTVVTDTAQGSIATRTLLVYPGAGAAAQGVNAVGSFPLPADWRAVVTHSAGGNFTYSVGVAYINK